MKQRALQNSKRFLFSILLIAAQVVAIPIQHAAATNDVSAACVIGTDSACPAQSPQEIYNLYGTTTDGTYYLNVGGVSTQVYLLMNQSNSDGGGWVLLMKGTKGTTNFGYSSDKFSSNTTTLNTSSLSNDVTTDAKFSAYNSLSIKKILAVFKDPTYGSISNQGDIANNAFGGHVWEETLGTATTAFSTLDTLNNISATTYTGMRYSIYRESNNSGATQVFAYEWGNAVYGFKTNACSGKEARWGASFNNESDWASCDTYVGIGLAGHSPGDQVTWTGGGAYQNPSGTGKGSTGFQIWGRQSDPSLATPGAITLSNLGSGNVQLSFAASSGATEYAIQYKSAGSNWNTSTTYRLTNPGGTPTAVIPGVTQGSYDFRVFARAANNSSGGNSSVSAQTIDVTAPTVSSISISSTAGADNIYGLGETITATVVWSETVTVTGSPRIPIQGLTSKYLSYTTGSGSTSTTFTYTIVNGDLDRDGFSITANTLELNSGTIKDAGNNSATLTHSAITASLTRQIDGVPPTLTSVNIPSDGSRITLAFSETISSTISAYNQIVITSNTVRNTVSNGGTLDSRLSMDLAFAVLSGSTVLLSYTDPSAADDINAIQDEAGNDLASFTNFAISNNSTRTSNTTAVIALNPASETAIFRAINTIRVTTNTAGKVDFYQGGKIITGCRSLATSTNVASCTWKPTVHSYVYLTARFVPTANGFTTSNSSQLRVYVTNRSGNR